MNRRSCRVTLVVRGGTEKASEDFHCLVALIFKG